MPCMEGCLHQDCSEKTTPSVYLQSYLICHLLGNGFSQQLGSTMWLFGCQLVHNFPGQMFEKEESVHSS